MKRREFESDENAALCLALRDSSVPMIATQDMPTSLRPIQGLLPDVNPEPFQEPEF